MHSVAQHNVDKPKTVKAFGPDGGRRRNYSVEDAEYLAGRRTVIAVRNRRGIILTIHFYGESRIPLKSRLKAGTKYSFREPLKAGCAWSLKRLPWGAVDAATGYVLPPEALTREMMAMFQQVPLSITAREPMAPVIEITSPRKLRKGTAQPERIAA
jgi:hypothetical protein